MNGRKQPSTPPSGGWKSRDTQLPTGAKKAPVLEDATIPLRTEEEGYMKGEEKLRRYLDRAFFGIRCSPAYNARTSKCLSPKHFEVL